jgi:hypothetical protein
MIRDMMVQCVEKRLAASRAPHPVEWLSDNGLIFAAHKTIEIAVAHNLAPRFTPVESPERNGMAEVLVKNLQARLRPISPLPNAAALAATDNWMVRGCANLIAGDGRRTAFPPRTKEPKTTQRDCLTEKPHTSSNLRSSANESVSAGSLGSLVWPKSKVGSGSGLADDTLSEPNIDKGKHDLCAAYY